MATRAEYESYLSLPQVRAALDTIAWAEGGEYNRLYGGGTFSGSQHPNRLITAGGYTSTAAGRYQFLYRTWIEIKNRLGLADFGPRNQDIAALDLIRQRGELDDLLAGRFEQMMRGLGCAWAALPFSGCGQRERSLASTLSYYNSALAVYGGRAVPANNLPPAAASAAGSGEMMLYGMAAVLLILLLE